MTIFESSPLNRAPWPWAQMDVDEVAERALHNSLYLPNIGYVDIGPGMDWTVDLNEAANSKRLWINSIPFVQVLVEKSRSSGDLKYSNQAVRLFYSYFESLQNNRQLFADAWRDEHAVSNRLFVLIALLHKTSEEPIVGLSQYHLITLIERHAAWLIDDGNYVINNHGVMMDISILNAGVILQEVSPALSEVWVKKAISRLDKMLNISFDEFGCCTENSPAYHYVNYSLFNAALIFVKEYGISSSHQIKWEEMLEKSRKVGEIIVRYDGKLPLIGDSEARIGTFFPFQKGGCTEGVGFYPKSGIFIYKKGGLYFTARAGGSSFSHRHIDDSSITLSLHNADFIVDAGLYNYDIGDRLRRWFTSHHAHSGFYLESASLARWAKFSRPEDVGGFNDLLTLPDGSISLSCYHRLSLEAEVHRKIAIGKNQVVIADSFQSLEPVSWAQQFLLHPSCEFQIDNEGASVTVNNNGRFLKMCIHTHGCEFAVEGGYYSSSFMKTEKIKIIKVLGCSTSADISLTIDF